jgi:hypothetical protein
VLRGQDPGVGHHKVDAQWILTHISRTQLDFSTATGGDYFYPNESYNVYGQPEATMEVDCPRSSSETPFPFLAPTFSLAHFGRFLMYIRALLWRHAKIDARVLLFPLSPSPSLALDLSASVRGAPQLPLDPHCESFLHSRTPSFPLTGSPPIYPPSHPLPRHPLPRYPFSLSLLWA